MRQALRIFAKDSRRFYPEILLAVLIELAFVKLDPERWGQQVSGMVVPGWLPGVVIVLVPVSWWLLISRSIHAESLVGERQFWVTRPYRWPSLLAAKALFIVAYVQVPFFLALCLLLKEAGFHPALYLPGLLFEVFMCTYIFVVPLVVLSSITGNLAKMTLALLILAAFAGATAYLSSWLPTAGVSTDFGQWIYNTTLLIAMLVIIVFQFARRRTGLSRWSVAIVAVMAGAIALEGPDNWPTNHAYPESRSGIVPPLQLAFVAPEDLTMEDGSDLGNAREVQVSFPIQISGIAAGTAIKADSAKVWINAQGGEHWSSHWQGINMTWLPGQAEATVTLKVNRSFFQKIKSVPVTVELSLALTELKAGASTTIRLPEDSFSIPTGTICKTTHVWANGLSCLSPLRQPPLMLVATRLMPEDYSVKGVLVDNGDERFGWIGTIEADPADFGITSVWISYVNFQRVASNGSKQSQHLWPGSTLAFAPYTIVERRQQKLTSEQLYLGNYKARSYM